jgi:CheY-like chemotaxis protein
MNEQEHIEKYLSSIRHDLRSQLLVVREGTSMALEGLGGKNCDKCFSFLRPALESADQMNKLIEELLSTSRFKAIVARIISEREGNLKTQKNERVSNDLETLKYELLGMISHAIRTPLTVVKEGLSLVLDEIPGKLNPQQKQFLSEAKQSADRLIKYVENILGKPWDKVIEQEKKDLPDETIEGQESPPGKHKILIVEDQPAIVNMVKMRLEANDYEVITAGNGQEGLEKARQENPRLIILDVMLPVMNGYKVCKLLKADSKYKGIAVIMASARPHHELRKLGKEVGADAFVTKPFEAQALLSTIKELLEKKSDE